MTPDSEIATAMTQWEDEDRASDQECVRCRDHVHTPADLEPTPLCNLCAQHVAGLVPELAADLEQAKRDVLLQAARLRALESELATLQASIVAALSSAGPEVGEDERAG